MAELTNKENIEIFINGWNTNESEMAGLDTMYDEEKDEKKET